MTDFSVQKIGRRDQLYAHKIGQSGPTGKEAAEARAQWAVHIPRDCLRIPCALKYTPEHSFSLAQIKFDFWEPLNLWNCQNLSKMSTVLYTDSVLLSHLWWVWIDRVWLEICPKSQTLLIQRHLWWTFDHILINFVPNCSMYALCEWSSEQLHSTGEVNTGGVLHLKWVEVLECKCSSSAQFCVGRGPGQGQLQLAEKGIPEGDHRHHRQRRRCLHRAYCVHHCPEHCHHHLCGDDH